MSVSGCNLKEKSSAATSIKGESLVWALSALAQLNRTPFDPKLIFNNSPPYTLETLHGAATGLSLKVGFKLVRLRT